MRLILSAFLPELGPLAGQAPAGWETATVAPAEHLELTGVFAACQQAGVPCGAALVVVNEVGPEAASQWQANHAEGSRRLVAALVASGWFQGA